MRRMAAAAIATAVLVTSSAAWGKTVRGTSGSDTLIGTPRVDAMFGYAGDDDLYAGPGNDHVYGGTGKDHIWGGNGNDVIVGGPIGDLAARTPATRHERIFGGAGDDVIVMRVEGSILFAGPGNDRIDVRDVNSNCRVRPSPQLLASGPERALDPPHCVSLVNTGPGENFVRADDGSLDSISCVGRRDRVVIDQHDVVSPECDVVRRVRR